MGSRSDVAANRFPASGHDKAAAGVFAAARMQVGWRFLPQADTSNRMEDEEEDVVDWPEVP